MTLTKFRIIVRRRWPLVALAGVLCLGAAYLVVRWTDDDQATLPESTEMDSFVSTGAVSVDRTRLYDQELDLGLAVLEVEAAGLYELVDEELGLPGGPEALRESTQIYPGQVPNLGGATGDDEDSGSDEDAQGAVVGYEAVIIQVTNLDGDTAQAQADATAGTWATLASLLDRQKADESIEMIGTEIDRVEQELLAFDQANPRIGLLTGPEVEGDAFLIAQRQRLEGQLTLLADAVSQQALASGSAAFLKLPTQEAQPVAEVSGGLGGDDDLTSVGVKWVLPVVTGLALAMLLVWLLEKMFPRVDTREDIQDELGIPVLAEVPRVRKPKTKAHSLADLHGPDAEMYRSLRSSLEFIATSNGSNGDVATNGTTPEHSDVIMVVSPTPGEGKTRSTALLGLSYAEAGHDVALLGCDFRQPKLHDYFGVEREPGLGSMVDDDAVDLADVVKQTNVEGLMVVPSGAPTNKTVPLLDTVGELIDEARATGVDVIIDTAPLLVANDTADLIEFADHVVVVVRAGKTHLNAAKEAIEVLRRHDAPIAGAVVVASHPAEGGYYNYYRRYGYYGSSHREIGSRRWLPWRRGGGGDGGSEPEPDDDPAS